MTAASVGRPPAKARLVRTGPTDRVVLRDHLRRALLETKADPSLCLALLLLRVKAERAEVEGPDPIAQLRDRLRNAVRCKPWRGRRDLVAWLGGGEFAILTAPLNGIRDAERIAGRLLALAAGSPQQEGEAVLPRLAIGIAAVDRRDRRAEEFLARARRALKKAEKVGMGWAMET